LDNKIAKLKSKLNPKSQEKNYDDVKSKIAPQQPAKSKDIYDRLKDMNFLEELTKEGKKEDVTGDGKIDSKDYLAKRNAAIQKAKGKMNEADMFVTGGSINPELRKKVEQFVKGVAKYYDYSVDDAFLAIMTILKGGLNKMNEDIDLGHEDNEPHMIKGELYQIGKYAMDLYAIMEELEETGGEYDLPGWWQSKITTAKNMISGAKHYLDFELKEPAIDAAVDALTGEAPHMGEPMMEDQGTLDQVRNELLSLLQPYGNFQILDMTMKGQNTGTEFRLYSKSKGANWKGLENFMRNNPDFTIKHISKQTFDNPKAIDFSYKKSPMNEDEIGKADILSRDLYKLKGKIQDAYFAKIRKFINMGSYEDAEYLLNRVKGQMNEKGLAETIAKKLKSK
jgi:hypothetical protein